MRSFTVEASPFPVYAHIITFRTSPGLTFRNFVMIAVIKQWRYMYNVTIPVVDYSLKHIRVRQTILLCY